MEKLTDAASQVKERVSAFGPTNPKMLPGRMGKKMEAEAASGRLMRPKRILIL
jgi:hypothetical protein